MCNIVWWWGGRFYLSYMRYTIIRVQVYIYYLIFLLFLMSELLFYPMSVFTWTPPVSDLSSCSQKLSSTFWIIFFGYLFIWSYAWLSGKESTCQCRNHRRPRLDPWVRKIPWRRKWQPAPVFLPGKSYGQRTLAGCSPWNCKESDTSEWLNNNKGSGEILKNFLQLNCWYYNLRIEKGRWDKKGEVLYLWCLCLHLP